MFEIHGDYRDGKRGFLTMAGEIVKSQGELAIANWLYMQGVDGGFAVINAMAVNATVGGSIFDEPDACFAVMIALSVGSTRRLPPTTSLAPDHCGATTCLRVCVPRS